MNVLTEFLADFFLEVSRQFVCVKRRRDFLDRKQAFVELSGHLLMKFQRATRNGQPLSFKVAVVRGDFLQEETFP